MGQAKITFDEEGGKLDLIFDKMRHKEGKLDTTIENARLLLKIAFQGNNPCNKFFV